MAFTIIIFTVLLAGIASGQSGSDEEGFGPNMMFHYVTFPPLPQIPSFPGMPPFPKLPQPPPLLMPNFPNMQMPNIQMPNIPQPQFISAEDIITATPKPGGSFSGVAINSESSASWTPDGKLKRKGGSTIMMNNDGDVTMQQMGDSPPPIIITKTKSTPFPDFPPKFKFDMPKMHKPSFGSGAFGKFPHFKPFVPLKMPKMDFAMPKMDFAMPKMDFAMPKMDIDDMKNYVPKDGEHVHASSSSSHSFSHNVNGVETSGGSMSTMTNVDGDVKEQKRAYEKVDPKP